MKLSVRRATLADLDTVMALETSGFAPGIVEDRAVFAQRIAVFPEGFLLAEETGKPPCGYFCTEIWMDWDVCDPARFDLGHDIADWLNRQGEMLYLASMTIAPQQRGTGLGRRLFRAGLDQMAQTFPHLREALLIVNEHWQEARKIYASEGFGEIARLPAFFQPDGGPMGDAIVMTRFL
ncbi:MAG: Mycothiol acetyltransferase [Betaproteobacteria bacterium ADurb.Bin341]|nr:MAG: Mycothiol acetyltransferase [Betaproteobacteria bacterium ADurb.Bin341]